MIYETTDDFYTQKIYLTNIWEPRFDFLSRVCRSKKVLHIGCADAMVFKAETNLHIHLSKLGEGTIVDGLDINVEATNMLAAECPGTYYTSYEQVHDSYDITIVPEVMEHVSDVHSFLKSIFAISSNEYLFTVPSMNPAQIFCTDTYCLEMVHPDHKYWFSPYTLWKVINPFSEGYDMKMYYLENKTQICIRLKKKVAEPEPILEKNDNIKEEANNAAQDNGEHS